MINNVKKLLFIDTSLNLIPLVDFDDYDEYVFINTLPRSKNDTYNYSDRAYDNEFFNQLLIQCKAYGFFILNIQEMDNEYYKKIFSLKKTLYYSFFEKPKYINPTLVTFINIINQKILKYYISTNIEYNMNNLLKNDINDCDVFIINEYIPNEKILEYFEKPKIFIGYSNTFFTSNENKNMCRFLLCNNNYITSKYFYKYFLFKEKAIKECENLIELITLKLSIIQQEEDNLIEDK
jgi:hypothetical protein